MAANRSSVNSGGGPVKYTYQHGSSHFGCLDVGLRWQQHFSPPLEIDRRSPGRSHVERRRMLNSELRRQSDGNDPAASSGCESSEPVLLGRIELGRCRPDDSAMLIVKRWRSNAPLPWIAFLIPLSPSILPSPLPLLS